MSLTLLAVLASAAPTTITVPVGGSIEASLADIIAAKEASELAAQVTRLLRWRGDVARNVHRGDTMNVIYEPGNTQTELIAIRYHGLQLNLNAYRYEDENGVPRFYDETGTLVEHVFKNGPVMHYTQITELPNVGRGQRKHAGVDFKAPIGTPVRLPFAGKVKRTNWKRVNGNCVEVEIAGGRLVRFLHLSSIDKRVKPGNALAVGAAIGAVGNTGRSSAPHLHYEMRDAKNNVQDPTKLHGMLVAKLAVQRLSGFAGARNVYDKRMAQQPEAVASLSAQIRR
ncbi:MAG: M23 family metallopeptidase [Clostridia bacterium]|nr:M23 family metallopeptidase [Deltaproteobacteria bacterium]